MGESQIEDLQAAKVCEPPARACPKLILAYFTERGSGCAFFVTLFREYSC
jgi:hypothetical protein